MNILIIHNSYQQAGGEDVVVAQERKLLERHGHSVATYERSNKEIDSLSFSERLGLITRIISANDSRLGIRKLVRELRPDVVHVHNTFAMVSPSAFQVCAEEDVPVVHTLHNYRLLCPASTFYRQGGICHDCVTQGLHSSVRHACYRDSRLMSGAMAFMLKTHRVRQTWNPIDAYIAISRFVRDKFVQFGFPASKIHVKPNFVDPDPGERARPGEYALFVGRLSREKGLEVLVQAWQLLQRNIPLVIVGQGPLRQSLEAEVSSKQLHGVHFAGQLKRDEVYAAMKNAAFLIVPSVWEEPFGMIIAEAFACGTPVLAAAVGAIQDMVDDQVTGLRFASNDAHALTKKVQWAWDHPSQMAEMGKAARRAYERSFTGNTNYQLMMNTYASAIETHFRSKPKRALRTAA
jgi:glycosyltransferase involved in cell wall biosynthesis